MKKSELQLFLLGELLNPFMYLALFKKPPEFPCLWEVEIDEDSESLQLPAEGCVLRKNN
jgi:hypothetical protein